MRQMVDSGRIPHAILLEGPSGSGKFSLARALAQYIQCTNRRPDGEPCGVCPACRQFESFNSVDTIYSFPYIKKNGKATVSADFFDDFKEFLSESPFMNYDQWVEKIDNANARPAILVEEGAELIRRLGFMNRSSKFKVVLMWLPEKLREDTANKLLKLIEEPTGEAVFILVSDNPREILPTIYSRVQRIHVNRYTDAEIALYLVGNGVNPGEAAEAARMAEGDMNKALEHAHDHERNKMFFDAFVSLMRLAYGRKVASLREWANEAAALGRETSMKFIEYCEHMVRESFIMHLHIDSLQKLTAAESAFLQKFFPYINEKNVEDLVELFDRARRDIGMYANAKIVFFHLAVRIIMLLRRK